MSENKRCRLRDLGISVGDLAPGPWNAITDVPGVRVGHCTLIHDEPRMARTGVTVIVPRDAIWKDAAFAGSFSFNGNGEMTGLLWLDESGLLTSPIAITNTHQVGIVRDAIVAYGAEHGYIESFGLPIVAETYDGWLNDINAFHLTSEHALHALTSAKDGLVAEGNVGGGTGMICHEFKGGIGTSSRIVRVESGSYTVGALVQANYGTRRHLRVNDIPVGKKIGPDVVPTPQESTSQAGSIIVVIATDAPLLPIQCTRLARRATVGLARTGGVGYNGSGDIFIAFATGNRVPVNRPHTIDLKMIPHEKLNVFFDAVAEAVEESILNALTSAETMAGFQGRTVYALPLDELKRVVAKYD